MKIIEIVDGKETQVDANFEQLEVLAIRYKEEVGKLRASLAEQNALVNKTRAELRKANDTIREFKRVLAELLIDN